MTRLRSTSFGLPSAAERCSAETGGQARQRVHAARRDVAGELREAIREAGLFAMCAGVPALLLALATWAIEGAVAGPAISVGLAFGSVYGVWKSRPRRGRA